MSEYVKKIQTLSAEVDNIETELTSQEKIAFLRQYSDVDSELQLKIDEKAMWMARATKITPSLSDMPKGGEQQNKIEQAVEKIVTIESEIDSELAELMKIRSEVKAAIRTVPSVKYREVLERRYIYGQHWEQIAVDMNYDYRWVLRLHGKALQMLKVATKSHIGTC